MFVHLLHQFKFIQKSLLIVCLMLLSGQSLAWTNITVLTTNDSPSVNVFISEFKLLFGDRPEVKINISKSSSGININIPKDTLVVAVGSQALMYASNLANTTPVIGVLVPKINYENTLKESHRDPKYFSAIYLDQPFERQIALIKAIFPDKPQIAVLLGPASQFMSNDLQNACNQFNMALDIRLVNKENELQSNLEALMQKKQILLAIPDPLIYTRETAQTILITSYRHQSPVIGFSQSYVKSGAIAAVFTSPKQFAAETAATIKLLDNGASELPSAKEPHLFSIQINYQVARSLDIAIPKEDVLYNAVLRSTQ
jgi:putative tryptophan/tyrosine transport system substrate-binding protein